MAEFRSQLWIEYVNHVNGRLLVSDLRPNPPKITFQIKKNIGKNALF